MKDVLKYDETGKTVVGVTDKNVWSVIIPQGVTIIGDSAFEDCRSLRSVAIPDSVTRIGDAAFGFCQSLANINIPSSVTCIGEHAFSFCESLICIIYKNIVKNTGNIWTSSSFPMSLV